MMIIRGIHHSPHPPLKITALFRMTKAPGQIKHNVDRWRSNEESEDRMRREDQQASIQAQHNAERQKILDSARRECDSGTSLEETISIVLGRTPELRVSADPQRQHEIAIKSLFANEKVTGERCG